MRGGVARHVHVRRRGPRKLKLNFVNADGRAIMPPIEIPVDGRAAGRRLFPHAQFHRQHPALKFAEAGLYSVDIRLDGESRANIPLQVKNPPSGGIPGRLSDWIWGFGRRAADASGNVDDFTP
jgi:hypothetical protein